MTRTHAICAKCYRKSPLQREPFPFPLPQCYTTEPCCYCGEATYDSIYVRDVLKPTVRCQCTEYTVHPKAPAAAPRGDAHYLPDGRLRSGMITHTHGEFGTYVNALTPFEKQISDDDGT